MENTTGKAVSHHLLQVMSWHSLLRLDRTTKQACRTPSQCMKVITELQHTTLPAPIQISCFLVASMSSAQPHQFCVATQCKNKESTRTFWGDAINTAVNCAQISWLTNTVSELNFPCLQICHICSHEPPQATLVKTNTQVHRVPLKQNKAWLGKYSCTFHRKPSIAWVSRSLVYTGKT